MNNSLLKKPVQKQSSYLSQKSINHSHNNNNNSSLNISPPLKSNHMQVNNNNINLISNNPNTLNSHHPRNSRKAIKINANIVKGPINPINEIIKILQYPADSRTLDEVKIIKDFLHSLPSFSIFMKNIETEDKEELLSSMINCMKYDFYTKNNILFRFGDKGELFYIILKGSVNVLIVKPEKIDMNRNEYLRYVRKLKDNNEYELLKKALSVNNNIFSISEKDMLVSDSEDDSNERVDTEKSNTNNTIKKKPTNLMMKIRNTLRFIDNNEENIDKDKDDENNSSEDDNSNNLEIKSNSRSNVKNKTQIQQSNMENFKSMGNMIKKNPLADNQTNNNNNILSKVNEETNSKKQMSDKSKDMTNNNLIFKQMVMNNISNTNALDTNTQFSPKDIPIEEEIELLKVKNSIAKASNTSKIRKIKFCHDNNTFILPGFKEQDSKDQKNLKEASSDSVSMVSLSINRIKRVSIANNDLEGSHVKQITKSTFLKIVENPTLENNNSISNKTLNLITNTNANSRRGSNDRKCKISLTESSANNNATGNLSLNAINNLSKKSNNLSKVGSVVINVDLFKKNAKSWMNMKSVDDYINDVLPKINKKLNNTNSTNNNMNNLLLLKDEKKTVTIYKYFNLVKLKQGDTFGEIALTDEFNKRSTSIIVGEDTHFGLINKQGYNKCLKEATEKITRNKINLLSNNTIFLDYPRRDFKKYLVNHFRVRKLHKGEKLLIENSKDSEYAYFTKLGQFDLYFEHKSINMLRLLEIYLKKNQSINSKINVENFDKLYENEDLEKKANKLIKMKLWIIQGVDIIGLEDSYVKQEEQQTVDSYKASLDIFKNILKKKSSKLVKEKKIESLLSPISANNASNTNNSKGNISNTNKDIKTALSKTPKKLNKNQNMIKIVEKCIYTCECITSEGEVYEVERYMLQNFLASNPEISKLKRKYVENKKISLLNRIQTLIKNHMQLQSSFIVDEYRYKAILSKSNTALNIGNSGWNNNINLNTNDYIKNSNSNMNPNVINNTNLNNKQNNNLNNIQNIFISPNNTNVNLSNILLNNPNNTTYNLNNNNHHIFNAYNSPIRSSTQLQLKDPEYYEYSNSENNPAIKGILNYTLYVQPLSYNIKKNKLVKKNKAFKKLDLIDFTKSMGIDKFINNKEDPNNLADLKNSVNRNISNINKIMGYGFYTNNTDNTKNLEKVGSGLQSFKNIATKLKSSKGALMNLGYNNTYSSNMMMNVKANLNTNIENKENKIEDSSINPNNTLNFNFNNNMNSNTSYNTANKISISLSYKNKLNKFNINKQYSSHNNIHIKNNSNQIYVNTNANNNVNNNENGNYNENQEDHNIVDKIILKTHSHQVSASKLVSININTIKVNSNNNGIINSNHINFDNPNLILDNNKGTTTKNHNQNETKNKKHNMININMKYSNNKYLINLLRTAKVSPRTEEINNKINKIKRMDIQNFSQKDFDDMKALKKQGKLHVKFVRTQKMIKAYQPIHSRCFSN